MSVPFRTTMSNPDYLAPQNNCANEIRFKPKCSFKKMFTQSVLTTPNLKPLESTISKNVKMQWERVSKVSLGRPKEVKLGEKTKFRYQQRNIKMLHQFINTQSNSLNGLQLYKNTTKNTPFSTRTTNCITKQQSNIALVAKGNASPAVREHRSLKIISRPKLQKQLSVRSAELIKENQHNVSGELLLPKKDKQLEREEEVKISPLAAVQNNIVNGHLFDIIVEEKLSPADKSKEAII